MTRPSLPEALRAVCRTLQAGVRVAVAAEVLAYDRTDQTVRVRPLVADPYIDGDPAWQEAPPIDGVPVLWLRAGSVTLTAGVEAGDVGLLLIRDRSHDEVDDGQTGEQVTPSSARRWDYADAVYLPAQVVPADPIGSGGHRADGAPVLAMGAGQALRVGAATASTAVARADRTEARLDALEAWSGVHTHNGVTVGAGTSGTATGVSPGAAVASGRIFTDD